MTIQAPSIAELPDSVLERLVRKVARHCAADAYVRDAAWVFACSYCGAVLGTSLSADKLDEAILNHQLNEIKKVVSQ